MANKQTILNYARKIQEYKDQVKILYDKIDGLTEKAIEELKPGEGFDYPNIGCTVELIDNFTNNDGSFKNVVFRPAAVRRFELVIKYDE